MQAHVGEWVVIEGGSLDGGRRQGQIVELVHPDGSPPYRVRWVEDDHESLVFPGPDAHRTPPRPAGGRSGLSATTDRLQSG